MKKNKNIPTEPSLDDMLSYFEKVVNQLGKYNKYIGYIRNVNNSFKVADKIWDMLSFLDKSRNNKIIDTLKYIDDIQTVKEDVINEISKIKNNISDKKFEDIIKNILYQLVQNEHEKEAEIIKREILLVYNKSSNPVDFLVKQFEEDFKNSEWTPATKKDYLKAVRKFSQVVIGFYHANTAIIISDNDDKVFCSLIAKNALFVSEKVFKDVKCGRLGSKENKPKDLTASNEDWNKFASWDRCTRARNNSVKKGTKCKDYSNKKVKDTYPDNIDKDNYKADDNTLANRAIKTAILESYKNLFESDNLLFKKAKFNFFQDYEACHVWDLPGDRRYYASVANLVLVPRALAQLTDHNEAVKQMLRYEVFNRFKFKPIEEEEPKPKYNSEVVWRNNFF